MSEEPYFLANRSGEQENSRSDSRMVVVCHVGRFLSTPRQFLGGREDSGRMGIQCRNLPTLVEKTS